jgi:hypothetical protein
MPDFARSGTVDVHRVCHSRQAATQAGLRSPDTAWRRFGSRQQFQRETCGAFTEDRKAGNAQSVARRTPRPLLDTDNVACVHTSSARSTLRTVFQCVLNDSIEFPQDCSCNMSYIVTCTTVLAIRNSSTAEREHHVR